jgi:hypothetical protein
MTMKISSIAINTSLYIESSTDIVRSFHRVQIRCNTSFIKSLYLSHNVSAQVGKYVINTIVNSRRIYVAVQFNAASSSILFQWLSFLAIRMQLMQVIFNRRLLLFIHFTYIFLNDNDPVILIYVYNK